MADESWQQFLADNYDKPTRALLLRVLYNSQKELMAMGALEDALASEEVVIQQVVTLVQGMTGVQDQLNAVQSALDALTTVEAQEKADLQAALDSAQAAVGTVNAQTAELQALVPPPPASPAG